MIHEKNTQRITAKMFLDTVKHILILYILYLKNVCMNVHVMLNRENIYIYLAQYFNIIFTKLQFMWYSSLYSKSQIESKTYYKNETFCLSQLYIFWLCFVLPLL